MKKQYRNYYEQVTDNVKIIKEFSEDIPSDFWEGLSENLQNLVTYEQVTKYINTNIYPITPAESTEDYWELESEYIGETMESVYQIYIVEPLHTNWLELERLELVYSHELECYLMPVYSFGMAWSMVGAYN